MRSQYRTASASLTKLRWMSVAHTSFVISRHHPIETSALHVEEAVDASS
jgi:hypothetical protein